MALLSNIVPVRKTYYIHQNTKNQSFLNMNIILSSKGIQNNAFFLAVTDPILLRINPRDPRINRDVKVRVYKECCINYWYFLREIVRIPIQGGSASSGAVYELHRGNLALNFCLLNNWNVFCELPRQHGKTISMICRILWEFLFATRNSEMAFVNKKFDDSKMNLSRLKEIRRALPSYLQMKEEPIDPITGKKVRIKDRAETIENPENRNKIVALSSATNMITANKLGRGCTQPRQWYDEFAFIPYNKVVYLCATPAFKTAAQNAKNNGAPYGIAITTTPGDLTTDEGRFAYRITELATPFDEGWYDLPLPEINNIINSNEQSKFIYIRYTYQQLGKSEEWFKQMCIDLLHDWDAIRREVLLEWAETSGDNPFSKTDLGTIESLCRKEPLKKFKMGHYTINIYKQFSSAMDINKTYLVGVDVAAGLSRDSSTFTVIDATTTEVIADFNCNYINTHQFAKLIYDFVKSYIPNSIINIERNGISQSVIANLMATDLKPRLYYEYKEKIVEERMDGMLKSKRKALVKNYGFDNNNTSRDKLMGILRMRVENHKDKFVSPILARELKGLIRTKRDRIDHGPNSHDDQLFSYLLALYMWYEGKDMEEHWGFHRTEVKCDTNEYEEIVTMEDGKYDITREIEQWTMPTGQVSQVTKDLQWLMQGKENSLAKYKKEEDEREKRAMEKILSTKQGREAYGKYANLNEMEMSNLSRQAQDYGFVLPDSVYTTFNSGNIDEDIDYENVDEDEFFRV